MRLSYLTSASMLLIVAAFLTVLKLNGNISCSWAVVTFPLWVIPGIAASSLILILIVSIALILIKGE